MKNKENKKKLRSIFGHKITKLHPINTWQVDRDSASDPSTRLFQRAIVIWDGQKNANSGPFYTILGHFVPL